MSADILKIETFGIKDSKLEIHLCQSLKEKMILFVILATSVSTKLSSSVRRKWLSYVLHRGFR